MRDQSSAIAAGPTGAPRPASQVDNQMRALREANDNAEKNFAALVERLGPVLRSAQPEGVAGDNVQEMLCPAADAIRTQAKRAYDLSARIIAITERIEA